MARGRWIQRAIKHPGELHAYVKREYGSRGFTERGTIKLSVLKKIAKKGGHIGHAARLAITLRRLGRRRRHRRHRR